MYFPHGQRLLVTAQKVTGVKISLRTSEKTKTERDGKTSQSYDKKALKSELESSQFKPSALFTCKGEHQLNSAASFKIMQIKTSMS